jgi:hypothetical protein
VRALDALARELNELRTLTPADHAGSAG